jgi:transcriptional regulator of acetoin/glycerol metabolism
MSGFFGEHGRASLAAQVTAVLARLAVRQGALALAADLVEEVVGIWRRARRGDRLVEFLVDVAAAYPAARGGEAQQYLRLAYREAEHSGQSWASSQILRMLDSANEAAVLDLVRAPRVPTGAPLAVETGSGAAGFYQQSRSEAFRRLLQDARDAAGSDITVLLLGETGVGKDWLAQYIHQRGERAARVYRAYNCGAVAESVLEAELFGYEKGAFTGAEQSRVGIFEAADGGTVLLDEVSELSPRAQAALLRVLDQRVVQPVGSTQPREVDVRILAATNRDLAEGVAAGRFRADLYYRLAVYPLRVPPLRQRAEDIPLLVQHFLGL